MTIEVEAFEVVEPIESMEHGSTSMAHGSPTPAAGDVRSEHGQPGVGILSFGRIEVDPAVQPGERP